MSAKRALTRFRAPDERAAEARGWEVVSSVYRQHAPAHGRRPVRRAAAGLAAAVVMAGALALSPAAATVGRLIDRALGVQHAAPALFSLPAPGRLLVSGPGATWTVGSDGSARRIGPWSEASWSPHGLYIAVIATNELAAVNPRGVQQWTLARPHVSDARWYSPTGYRVAYLSGHELRVVAGDGTGDRLIAQRVKHVAPAWRPGRPYQLAYAAADGRVVVGDGDTSAGLWSANPRTPVRKLAWSADGERLLALSPQRALIYSPDGKLLAVRTAADRAPLLDGAIAPDGRMLAVVTGGVSDTVIIYSLTAPRPVARRVLAEAGLGQVAWSPDGRWVLISWPAANQWVFVRVVGQPRIAAVSRISQQFSAGSTAHFPRVEGWCCDAAGAAG